MGGMECVITGIMDEFRDFFRQHRYSREIFTLTMVGISYCVAISNITKVRKKFI